MQSADRTDGNLATQGNPTPSHPTSPLTPNQRAFAIELAKGAHKTDAYITAFRYKGPRKHAQNSALKLGRDPRIAEFIAQLAKRAVDLGAVSKDDISLALAEIAFSDIRQVFDAQGEMLPPHEWPDSIARCVSGYEEKVAPGGTILTRKIRLWDKPGSLKLMAEINSMLGGKPDSTQRAHFVIHLGGVPPAQRPSRRVKGVTIDHEPGAQPVDNQPMQVVLPVTSTPKGPAA